MTREELQKDIERRTEQMRPLIGDLAKAEEIKKGTDELRALAQMARDMDKSEADLAETRAALQRVPAPPPIVESSGWAGVRSSLAKMVETRQGGMLDISGIERRAVTANGAGYNTMPGIIRAIVDGGKLRSKVSVFMGKNSVSTVPVWAPTIALPAGSVPGATGGSVDSTGALTGDPLTLKPWIVPIQVSNGALFSTDIEAELPAIFSEAYGGAIDKAICVGAGSGSDMLGVFIASSVGVATAQDVTCTGSGAAPVWADYVNLALTLLGLGGSPEDYTIVVAAGVFQTALGVAAAGSDPFKIEYLQKQTILGIPVIITGYGLTTLTSGSYVAVGGKFKHYALAVAQEIGIKQIDVVGSDNVVFQASMYMQGKPLISTSFRRLKTG